MECYKCETSTVEFDPMCDKENPQRISFEDVSAAAFRIQSGIVKTPCMKSHMSTIFGMDIYLKNDFLQHTGSFKERGARNALLLLPKEAKLRGVISASLGNHSQGLSYHANKLNIPTTVVMPNVAPIMKIQKCQSYGANVIIHGHDMKEAKYHAMTLAKERGLTYINGYDHPHIMAGQGTVGLEIVEQVPDVDAVLVPVGGGGLLAGVATAIKHLKPHVLIYGVETEKCPSMKEAMDSDEPVCVDIRSTLADGLAVPTVGYNAFVTVKPIIDKLTVEFDPMCDKENPQRISFEDVSAAAFRIQSGIVKTPCMKSHMSTIFGMDIYLKNDFLQHTGSFKERGARNALLLLPKEAKLRGVISASLGNHSQGLSYHANKLNIPTTVVMPNVAPIMKIQKCQSYGANVIIHGHDMKEAKYHAMTLAKERGLTYINGYDHPHIMAGQGTVGLEIVEQVPDVDAVLVPVGGGGLLAGVATAIKHLKPHVLIYGVETEKCPSMKEAMDSDEPVCVDIRSTLADGLAVPTVGYNAFVTVKPIIDKLITVNEDWIARAILRLVEQEKYVVEGGGAVGVAAIMAGLVPELASKKVVCILSGGNIDTTILGRCLERGLAAEDRLVKFKVTVSDRPGGIAELCKLLSSIGVSIKDIMQERAWVYGDIFSVRVKVVCETRGPDHLVELRRMIAQSYREWDFARQLDEQPRRPSTASLDDISH